MRTKIAETAPRWQSESGAISTQCKYLGGSWQKPAALASVLTLVFMQLWASKNAFSGSDAQFQDYEAQIRQFASALGRAHAHQTFWGQERANQRMRLSPSLLDSLKTQVGNRTNWTYANRGAFLPSCPPKMAPAHSTIFHDSQNHNINHTANEIPRAIHMMSKTRCMTRPFLINVNRWRFPNHSLYVHDDESANQLFAMNNYWQDVVPRFKEAIQCLPNHGASSASKADLWRYVMLWNEGGVYTDLDNMPGELFQRGLMSNDYQHFDAAIVLRPDKQNETLRKPGQSFLLMSPHHPLMYLCWKRAVRRLLAVPDLAAQRAFVTTGPHVLDAALAEFLGVPEAGTSFQPGTFSISSSVLRKDPFLRRLVDPTLTNRTVTLLSNGTREEMSRYILTSVGVRRFEKLQYYNLSGMTVWQTGSGDDRQGVSCARYLGHEHPGFLASQQWTVAMVSMVVLFVMVVSIMKLVAFISSGRSQSIPS